MALDEVLRWRPPGAGRPAGKSGKKPGRDKAAGRWPALPLLGLRRRRTNRIKSSRRAGAAFFNLARLRSIGLGLSGLIALAVVSLGLVAGYQALLVSPFFRLEKLSLSGQEQLDRYEIMRLAGLTPGVNLLKLDLDLVRARLTSSPWVEAVSLRRVLPDELRLHLQERKPQALLSAGELWYLDGRGRPFKKVEAGERLDLPVVSGIDEKEIDTPEGRRDLALALEIIGLLAQKEAPVKLAKVSEIRFSRPQGVVLLPVADNPRIILGRGRMGPKMDNWRRVLSDLSAKGLAQRVDYIDLRLEDRAFVGLKAR